MRKLYFTLFILWFIIACSDRDKVPKGILKREKMQEVIWDMVNASEFLGGYILNKDSVDRFAESSKIYGQVLQFHHITREQFDKSYLYYRQHPDLMKVILDTLSKRQIPPEEIYKPKQDSVKADTAQQLADSAKIIVDSTRKRIPKKFRGK
ncbi:MAG: DUF4296 domain-containing protein [Chitinophagaceae bacterium]|nr:DUF4296 domain-containing protein [Chitinophagaceae bacterium]